jgi:hypothetical protein
MATWGEYISIPGLRASGTLTQYATVKFASTAGRVVAVNATTDRAIGILQNDPTDGEPAEIAALGVAIGLAGATDLAVGDLLGFNSSAQVADHTTDGRFLIGVALQASTAVNDEVKVLLTGLNSYGG